MGGECHLWAPVGMMARGCLRVPGSPQCVEEPGRVGADSTSRQAHSSTHPAHAAGPLSPPARKGRPEHRSLLCREANVRSKRFLTP